MQPQAQDARPPYVTFEKVAVEDRAASLEANMPRFRDVDYAYITPAGSKDRIPKVVSEWFAQLPNEVQAGRFPGPWLEAYKAAYGAWKEGRELPENGQSIMNWPVVTPAQTKLLLDLRIRTVEDMAVANEETLQRIGMGGRALKAQAESYLKAATAGGLVELTNKLSTAQIANEALKTRNDKLEAQLTDLATRLKALEAPATA